MAVCEVLHSCCALCTQRLCCGGVAVGALPKPHLDHLEGDAGGRMTCWQLAAPDAGFCLCCAVQGLTYSEQTGHFFAVEEVNDDGKHMPNSMQHSSF